MTLPSMDVAVNRVGVVRPHAQDTKGKMVLGLVDHHVWYIPYRARILFYDRPNGFDFDAFVENLRISLAKALDLFYPFAGRLCSKENGILEVDCNGAGVLFIEAKTYIDVSYFQSSKVSGCHGLAQTLGHRVRWPWRSDAPLVIIQVTEIGADAFSVSFRYSHQICDGMGAWHFVKTWAEICRGQNVSLHPRIMYRAMDPDKRSKHVRSIQEAPARYKYCAEQPNEHHDTLTKCFTFDREFIQKLKDMAHHDELLSTFQLLSAHIWSKITMAREIPSHQDTRLMFPVNCRDRNPEFPKGYFGNGALMFSIILPAGKLLSNFIVAARTLKYSIDSLTSQKIDVLLDLIVEYGDPDHDRKPDHATAVRIGSSFKFPVYESDFGYDAPMDMTCLPEPCDGTIYYFPGKDQGSVDAHISLKTETMLRMEKLDMNGI